MSLDNEIKESIEKNLPAMVGKKLQERLAVIEELENKLNKIQIENDSLRIENAKLTKNNRDLVVRDTDVTELAAKIAKREAVVTDIEHTLEIAALKLEFANKGAETVERLFNTVFRNTVVRNRVLDQVATEIYNTQYNPTKQCNETVVSGTWLQPVNKEETKAEE